MERIGPFTRFAFIACILSLVIGGCSSITIKHHAIGVDPPLCKAGATPEKVVVYWGVAWRTDQKEPSIRKALVTKGIEKFFGSNRCFETLSISRNIAGQDALLVTDFEAISEAKALGSDKVFIIRIYEFGPNLMLYLSPILWQTKNEVLLQVRSINIRTGRLEADISTHWMRGGPFTIIGAKSLPVDFAGALNAVFLGTSSN